MKTTSTKKIKHILFILGILAFFCIDSYAQTAQRIRLIVGTRSRPSSDGKGCDGDKGFCFIFGSSNKTIGQEAGVAEVQVVKNQLMINMISDPSPAEANENTFYVYEDKVLPMESSEELGYSKIIIRKGQYPIDKSRNRLGSVLLNASFY